MMNSVYTKASGFAATVADTSSGAQNAAPPELARGSAALIGLSTRTTVLPRLVRTNAPAPASAEQRFVPLRVLGRGGLGEVTLVQDNDIDRTVALKRLHLERASDELVFRFAQEI